MLFDSALSAQISDWFAEGVKSKGAALAKKIY